VGFPTPLFFRKNIKEGTMKGRKWFLLGIFLVLMLALTGCGDSSDSDDDSNGTGGTGGGGGFANVVGTMSMPAPSIGNTYIVALDNNLDGGDGFINTTTSTVTTGPSQAYSLGVIPTGSYYLYALVYNSGGSGAPEDGDYYGFYGGTLASPPSSKNAVVTPGDVTLDITLQTWNESGVGTPGGATVSGTLTGLPAGAVGRQYWVVIDNDFDGGNNVLYSTTGTCSSTSQSYTIDNVAAGTYYVYAVVYVVGSGDGPPQDGDYVGIYGGSLSGGLPPSANVTVTDPGPTPNIDMATEECTGGACSE
jgi:hypothetical protein